MAVVNVVVEGLVNPRVREIDSKNIIAYSHDAIFDKLEDALDEIESERRRIALARAKEPSYLKQLKFDNLGRLFERINTFWNLMVDAPDEEFYLTHNNSLESEQSAIEVAKIILDNLLVKGTVIKQTYEQRLSLERGAYIEPVTVSEPAYVPFGAAEWHAWTVGVGATLKQIQDSVSYINTSCRIFKCKDCGEIDYVAKSDDLWKVNHGLNPVQRCSSCIQKRRELREKEKDKAQREKGDN